MQYVLLIYTPEPTEASRRRGAWPPRWTEYNAFTEHVRDAARCRPARRSTRWPRRRPSASSTARRSRPTGRSPRRRRRSAASTWSRRPTSTRRSSYAAMIPGAQHGSIEVRPVWDYRDRRAADGRPRPTAGELTPSATAPRLTEPDAAHDVVDRLFREEQGRAVATLIRVLGDFDLAEEAVQDAFITALETWPEPRRPGQPRRVDHDDGPQPGDRPAAAAEAAGREDRGAGARGGDRGGPARRSTRIGRGGRR